MPIHVYVKWYLISFVVHRTSQKKSDSVLSAAGNAHFFFLHLFYCVIYEYLARSNSYTQISPLRNQEIRRHVPFLNWNPHTIVVGQNAWNQVKFMYRFLGAEFLMTEIWVYCSDMDWYCMVPWYPYPGTFVYFNFVLHGLGLGLISRAEARRIRRIHNVWYFST